MRRTLAALLALAAVRGSLLPLEAEHLHASVGGYAVMNCHLDFPFGNEIPYHLQWDKDGETIFSWYSGEPSEAARVADRWGGRVQRVGDGRALGRGSVNVTAVRETDAGLYRCRVTFPNRSPPARNNGTFYYLEVDGGNLIATPPVNATVLEGSRAELECLPKNPEAVVQWYKDDTALSLLPELALRSDLPSNGSLVIRSTTSTDIGEYECRVSEPDGTRQSAAAFLDVHYKAKVVYSPEERYLPYGKPASLDCHFSANPPLTNLRWEKDGFLFDPYNVPGVFYSRNGSLLFNKVDESHEGLYSCTPYNALGSAGPSPAVRVRVQRPPRLAARPAPLYLARLGQGLSLPCAPAAPPADGTGAAPPAVTWTRKDGRELPEGRHSVLGGNLTLTDIAEEDRGEYVCTVTNEAAALTAATELLVENAPPRAPHRLAAAPAARRLRLTWQPGHGSGSDDVEYTVWYRERAAHEWRTLKLLSRGVTEATLRGLRPAAVYELRVLAQDSLGDGLFSKPLFVTTPDDSESSGEGEAAYAVAVTESDVEEGTEGSGAGAGAGGGELEVTVRLVDDGALVRWRSVSSAAVLAGRCAVRWYGGEPAASAPAPAELGEPGALLVTAHTHHDYLLVGSVEEGGRYWARVQCAGGARGGAELRVPRYSRLRAVAAAAAAGALLLAALAAALYASRRRLRACARARARACAPPPPPARLAKCRR